MSPQRVQLSRQKGWRKPEGVIVVARPSKWGNPWRMQDVDRYNNPQPTSKAERDRRRRAWAVAQYGRELEERGGTGNDMDLWTTTEEIRADLGGKDLGCWCPLDQPCHADVLLEVANR